MRLPYLVRQHGTAAYLVRNLLLLLDELGLTRHNSLHDFTHFRVLRSRRARVQQCSDSKVAAHGRSRPRLLWCSRLAAHKVRLREAHVLLRLGWINERNSHRIRLNWLLLRL